MKRMILLFLALCLIGSLIPFRAFATGDPTPPDGVCEESREETAPAEDPCEVLAEEMAEGDIERIEVAPVTLIEHTEGDWRWYEYWDEALEEWVEDQWFRYDVTYGSFTVYYKDGTAAVYERYDEGWYDLEVWFDQSGSSPWGIGTHIATATYMGVSCQFEVHIIASPVERIEIAPMTCVEGTMGYWWHLADDNAWFDYDVYPEEITVYYMDGSVVTSSYWDIYDETGYWLHVDTDQSEANPWQVGTHTATGAFMGVTCEFEVTINQTPVERIEVSPVTVTEKMAGFWEGHWDEDVGEWLDNTWFNYSIEFDEITVYYKDGTVVGYHYSSVEGDEYGVWCDSDQDYDNQWGLGTHWAVATFMGVTCEYEVIVQESPVAAVSLIREPDKTSYMVGEYLDLRGAVLRVEYVDGTYEDVHVDVFENDNLYYLNKLGSWASVSPSVEYLNEVGTHEIEVSCFLQTCTLEVQVAESSIIGITISSSNERDLHILATRMDGTTQDITVRWFDATLGDGDEGMVMLGGNLYTDAGVYFGIFYKLADGGVYLEADMGPGCATLQSNILDNCGWVAWVERIDNYLCTLTDHGFFAGEVNADNIEWMISAMRWYNIKYRYFDTDTFELPYTVCDDVYVYEGDDLRAAFAQMYGVTNVDLSVSKRYDAETDQYTVDYEGWGRYPYGKNLYYMEEDGLLKITCINYCGVHVTLVLDENNRIRSYTATDTPAVDEDEAFRIIYQSGNYVGMVGDMASFTVKTNRDDVSYQWYLSKDGGSSWERSNFTDDTMNIEFKAYRRGYLFRCEITDAEGNTVVSDTVSLIALDIDLVILTQPVSYVGAVNDDVTFTVEASGNGLVYEWFYSSDGAAWVKTYSSGYATDTLCPILRSHRDGNMYKCVITDVFGNSVESDVVSMSVKASDIIIVNQPRSVINAIAGQLYGFAVVAEGDNLTYRWELSTDGGETWQESWNQGYNTANLSVRMNPNRDGNRYRCCITSGQKIVAYTEAAILDMQDPSAALISQSGSMYITAGATAAFTVEAEGMDLTYAWHRSNDKGATWIRTYLPGYNTDTLSFAANVNRAAMYMCKITDGSGTAIWSDPVKLQVLSAELKILAQPVSTTCAYGQTASFTVVAQGDTLKYQWYSSSDGESWSASYLAGYNTDTFSFIVNTNRATKMYKCVITDVVGKTVETDTVSVTIR